MKSSDSTRRCFLGLLLGVFCLVQAVAQNANNPDAILGKWLTGTGKAHIEVYRQGNKYFGKIVWLKAPLTEDGKPKMDKNNPDDKLKDRPLLGLVNLSGFDYTGDQEYENGRIYDPESGKTYSCVMKLKEPDLLAVRGYVGISLIGRTDSWRRVK